MYRRKKEQQGQEARKEGSRSGKREVEREEEITVIKKRSMNLIFSEVFKDFSPVDDLGTFKDSWSDLHGDSCGFSVCVLVVSLGVSVVTDVRQLGRRSCKRRLRTRNLPLVGKNKKASIGGRHATE